MKQNKVTSRFIEFKGKRAHFLECGQGKNLILLHGWFQDASGSIPLIKILGKNFRVLAPDFFGFGQSSKPPPEVNIEIFVNFVFDFVTALNIQRFYLCGVSLGGTVALKLLTQDSRQMVEKAIIIGGGIFLTPQIKKNKLFFAAKRIYEYWITYVLKGRFTQAFFVLRSTLWNLVFHLETQIQVLDKATDEELSLIRKGLENIKAMVLILWAEKDSVFPVEQAYFLKNKVKNSNLRIIPNTLHPWSLAEPEKTAREITDWCKKD